jgi:poly-gamma-glutamate capsule biosynthesis protein CapA/YwtB (metallophosphatase superfamily)
MASKFRRPTLVLLAALVVAGCLPDHLGDKEGDAAGGGGGGGAEEESGWETGIEVYEAQPIGLEGEVRSTGGEPVDGAHVEWHRPGRENLATRTNADGEFAFEGLDRRNGAVVASVDGFQSARVPVRLRRSLDDEVATVDPVLLSPADSADARLLFGGDVSLGRRFFDPEDGGPRDRVPEPHEDARIDTSDPTPDTKAILQFIRPRLSMADYTAINLETPITDDPDTPFPGKRFVFFSLPGSLPALEWAGVDYVGLGNNHLFDYQTEGVAETTGYLDETELAYSGVGMDVGEAFRPHRLELGGSALSLISAGSIVGLQYDTSYAAGPDKAGVANLRESERVRSSIEREVDRGRAPVAIFHTGTEYREQPGDETHAYFEAAADAGASLVIAHHPHVAQGFEWRGDTLVAHSLGNMVFDQQRLETLRGMLAQVEMDDGRPVRAMGVPVYLEDTRPREIADRRADRLLRRVGGVSEPWGTTAFPYNDRIFVPRDEAGYEVERRSVEVTVEPEGKRGGIIDLREHAESDESLADISFADEAPRVKFGRDIMGFGGMEDMDVDRDQGEASRWYYTGGSSRPCYLDVHRGALAMCSHRTADNSSKSIVAFRNRIRVVGNPTDEPNKDLTLFGYTKKENAGRVQIEMRHRAPLGPKTLATRMAYETPPMTHDWRPFVRDLEMPPDDPDKPESRTENARAVRFSIWHYPPPSGEAMLRLDDLATITWVRTEERASEVELGAPNPVEFVRVDGDRETYEVELIFERHVPVGSR